MQLLSQNDNTIVQSIEEMSPEPSEVLNDHSILFEQDHVQISDSSSKNNLISLNKYYMVPSEESEMVATPNAHQAYAQLPNNLSAQMLPSLIHQDSSMNLNDSSLSSCIEQLQLAIANNLPQLVHARSPTITEEAIAPVSQPGLQKETTNQMMAAPGGQRRIQQKHIMQYDERPSVHPELHGFQPSWALAEHQQPLAEHPEQPEVVSTEPVPKASKNRTYSIETAGFNNFEDRGGFPEAPE